MRAISRWRKEMFLEVIERMRVTAGAYASRLINSIAW